MCAIRSRLRQGHPPARAPGVRGTSRHVARSPAIPARRPPRQVEPVRGSAHGPHSLGVNAFVLGGGVLTRRAGDRLAVHEEPALPSGV